MALSVNGSKDTVVSKFLKNNILTTTKIKIVIIKLIKLKIKFRRYMYV